MEVIDNIQVQRVWGITLEYRKNSPYSCNVEELQRYWIDKNGTTAVTARKRYPFSPFLDVYLMDSDIELRVESEPHIVIANCDVAANGSYLPIFRQRGLAGRPFPKVNPIRLFKGLLNDPRIETTLKCGDMSHLDYFLENPSQFNNVWESYKLTIRHNYRISDISLWADMVNLLVSVGKDIHNPKYICPSNLNEAHDEIHKLNIRRVERKRQREEVERIGLYEELFQQNKSKYFNIRISEGDMEIVVLDSVRAYYEEGAAMHHCVYSCKYFQKPESLVLSARINGHRVETIEINLNSLTVLQSRGCFNRDTEHHDRIIKLVNDNIHKFAI